MNSIILKINSSKEKDINPDEIKKFILQSSYAINKKIFDLETKYNINIKLPPLEKKIPVVKKNSGAIYPTMGITNINTGLTGQIMYPTQFNITPLVSYGPFLFDPINQINGENYKQRLEKISKYLKIYKIIKPQLDTYNKDKDKTKVDSRYVEFLEPLNNKTRYNNNIDDDSDIDSIQVWLNEFYNKPNKTNSK